MPSRAVRDRLTFEQVADRLGDARGGDPPLAATVAIADRDGAVAQALAVDGDAKGRARLVLPPITPADRPFLIVRNIVVPLEIAVDRLGPLGHAVALHQGKTAALIGAIRG